MHVVGLWRYPVKSMQGEAVEVAEVATFGLAGDRRYGVEVEESGRILSAKREGRLLTAGATTAGTELVIRLPTGERLDGPGPACDAALSAWLERPVHLVEAPSEGAPTFESQSDMTDDDSPTLTWEGHPDAFVDSSPVHLLTTASLRAMAEQRPELDWDVARFRPNVLVDAPGAERLEDGWVGRHVRVGEVELEVVKRCERCVMVTRPQPGGRERQRDILAHLSRVADATLGVLARVVRTGPIAVGTTVRLD